MITPTPSLVLAPRRLHGVVAVVLPEPCVWRGS